MGEPRDERDRDSAGDRGASITNGQSGSMRDFGLLIGEWHGEGAIQGDPPMTISEEVKIERLGEFIVFSTVGQPAEMPDSLAIIGGAPDGEPQPMHYFDSRGIKRLYMMSLEGSIWRMWRAPADDWNGPNGPGFDQRFIGELSAEGTTIEGRWERGMGATGDEWELDFPITYVRR